MEKINGLIAAPFTPMHPDGSIKFELVPDYYRRLIQNGYAGAFVCGTTGEFTTLTLEERMSLVEAWKQVASDDFRLIVNVSTESIRQSSYLASHAADHEVSGISSLSPVFFKPASVKDLVSFLAEITGSVPALPFYYYHIPGITGVNLSVREILEEAQPRIPSLAGVKFTAPDLYEENQCRLFGNGRFDILHGLDETLLSGLQLGVNGGVGGTYSYSGSLYPDLVKDFKEGRMESANQKQALAQEMIRILIRYGGNVRAGKTIMKLSGLDCGPNRLPNVSLSASLESSLRVELEDIGFLKK